MRIADGRRRAVSSAAPASSPPPRQQPDFEILQQAAEWFALLRAEKVAAADRERWREWLGASPTHAAAWRRIEAVNQQFGQLPGPQARETLATGAWQKRQTGKKLALIVAGVLAGGGLLGRPESRQYMSALNAGQRTETGRTRQLALDDGSQLWLNTASAADIEYNGLHRLIALHRGELLLRSAKDSRLPARPLLVDVPQARLRALGTRFSVRLDGDTTRLAVFDGAVRIEPASGLAPRVVQAGSQLSFGADWIGPPGPSDERDTAWIECRLIAENMRLDHFLAELGRYRHGHLACAPAVADLRLTGSYPLADTERVLNSLEMTLKVRVNRLMPWWVTVEAA